MSGPHVYNMPSGLPFLPSLAEGLSYHYGEEITRALILLPTRRAVYGLRQAFSDLAEKSGKHATLLPRMKPLADINPEEPPFEPGELAGEVPPAVTAVQRRFEMAKLVAAYHRRAADLPLDPAAALALADPLLAIMDDAAMEEVSITETDEWQKILADSAAHFQHAATLYRIIETYWPKRLKELGLIEAQARKVKLLNALAEHWTQTPPDYPVIIAGSTGTLKATARLMACVAHMPRGMIVLPGLQTTTDPQWDKIDVQHPQYSLKQFVDLIDMDRIDVTDWRDVIKKDKGLKTPSDYRRLVINEALVATQNTSDWLTRIATLKTNHGDDIFTKAMDGLSLITAPNDEDEALSIALILRETLETPAATAALVTPDQGLAQRVQSRLGRWGVSVDMSQGEPLTQTELGTFLSAIIALAHDPEDPVALSVLFNHSLMRMGHTHKAIKTAWQALELKEFRGPRPTFKDKKLPDLLQDLYQKMMPLLELGETAPVHNWAAALVTVAEHLATHETVHGANHLWSSEAGRQALKLLDGLIGHGAELPETDAHGLDRLLRNMMRQTIVRYERGNQPRLSILGPLEARLITADTVILGGLNDGVWPANANSDPFLSRGMRKEMGLSLPERRFGLSAHDFAELAANPRVILTRSQRDDSGPMVANRWVWRLQTLLKGALGEKAAKAILSDADHYMHWAQALDYVPADAVTPAQPPAPAPPGNARWAYAKGRSISITQVKNWVRDPYSIYAKHSLGLSVLDPLDMRLDARHFGMALHKGIENYIKVNRPDFHEGQTEELVEFFQKAFADHDYPQEDIAHETVRFEVIARDLINWLQSRQAAGYDIFGSEIKADYHIEDLDFRLSGIADLIEQSPQGYAFFDFKSGTPASIKEVTLGFDPQLPLSAWLASQGGFAGLPKGQTKQLGYVRVKGSNNGFNTSYVSAPDASSKSNPKLAMELAEDAIATLRQLIKKFDQSDTPYFSQPRVKYQNRFGDFDHLARRAEWAGIINMDGGEP